MTKQPVTILIVEDDEIDRMSINRVLRDLKITNEVCHAKDGVAALELLRQNPQSDQSFVIFLDLNMPRMNGIEFLKNIRSDEALQGLTVFVLTTSDTDDDVTAAYAYNVEGYIVKSDLKDSLQEAISTLETHKTIVN